MSKTKLFLFFILIPFLSWAQPSGGKGGGDSQRGKVVVVDDEECGCELVFIDGIQTIERNNLFGFKREDGTVFVEPKYKFVDEFHGNYCIVYKDYDQCGLIDRTGREIVPTEYGSVNYPTDGMIRVSRNGLYGFIDTMGNTVIDCRYRTASGFSEGLAVVIIDFDSSNYGYGFIDKQGNISIPAEFEYAQTFQEGYAIVRKYDRYGMIDKKGNEVLPYKYLELTPMFEGNFFAVDALSDKAALFDRQFRRLTDFVYENISAYSEGYYVVKRDGKTTFLDKKGKERFGFFEDAGGFYEGYSMVKLDGKYGIINQRGKVVLPIEYENKGLRDRAYIFVENLALIEKDGRYGFVNKRGEIVIPIIYESAFFCSEGLIAVRKDNGWGYIDSEGNALCPFKFNAASYFQWGRAEVVYDGKVYKINTNGQCVKSCKDYPSEMIFKFPSR